jgi:parallel beta-helix repeat protein
MFPLAVPLAVSLFFQASSAPSPASAATKPSTTPSTAPATVPLIGTEPLPSLGARDIYTDYHLPPLEDRPADTLWQSAARLQVISRARHLNIGDHSAVEAWKEAETTFRAAREAVQAVPPASATIFSGAKASELNTLIAAQASSGPPKSIRVTSPALEVDAPIRITGEHLSLDLGEALLERPPAASSTAPSSGAAAPYMIRVEQARDVRISGGKFRAGAWAVLIAGSHNIVLTNLSIEGLSGGGVLVTGSEDVTVWGNTLLRLGAAPVLLHGSTRHAVVAENDIEANVGNSNWNAGVVLTDRDADLATDPTSLLQDDQYWAKQEAVIERLRVPMDNLIADNHIAANLSSGVYSDGSIRNVVVGNRIERNSKEGMCLDNGSAANVVAYNLFQGNGQRWGKTDAELKRDFVFNFGRLQDGTSPAKVPAISIDNAAFNEIMFNEINRNYGGGVKMVRTGFYNMVGLNTITDNNEGRGEKFHFFGVELGAATSDAPSNELDFTASHGNQIFSNAIRGTHYAGIFFADGSDDNVIFDNSIFGATSWAMESVRRQPNLTINNLTNLKLRNIGSGLDPSLLKTGAGAFDAP